MITLGTASAGVVIGALLVMIARRGVGWSAIGYALVATAALGVVAAGLAGWAAVPVVLAGEAVGIVCFLILVGAHRAAAVSTRGSGGTIQSG